MWRTETYNWKNKKQRNQNEQICPFPSYTVANASFTLLRRHLHIMINKEAEQVNGGAGLRKSPSSSSCSPKDALCMVARIIPLLTCSSSPADWGGTGCGNPFVGGFNVPLIKAYNQWLEVVPRIQTFKVKLAGEEIASQHLNSNFSLRLMLRTAMIHGCCQTGFSKQIHEERHAIRTETLRYQ